MPREIQIGVGKTRQATPAEEAQFDAPPVPLTYREQRRAAYIAEIGGGDAIEGFGTMFDALYWSGKGDQKPWNDLVKIIDAIKARIPKPEEAP